MPSDRLIKREHLIEPPNPMRVAMDEEQLRELAHSMRDLGQLFPLLVCVRDVGTVEVEGVLDSELTATPNKTSTMYEIIDGHRRYLAAALVGITELKCTVFDDVEEAKFAMMVHANIMREDVTPAEEGLQYLALAEKHGWGIDQLMRTFRRSEGYINDRVALVRGDAEITKAVAERKLVFGVAKILLKCKDDAHRHYLLTLALTHGASLRTAEAWLADWKSQEASRGGAPAPTPVMIDRTWQPPPPEACTWCLDTNDQEHMVMVAFHRWHLKELLAWLQRSGVHPSSATISKEPSVSHPAALPG